MRMIFPSTAERDHVIKVDGALKGLGEEPGGHASDYAPVNGLRLYYEIHGSPHPGYVRKIAKCVNCESTAWTERLPIVISVRL